MKPLSHHNAGSTNPAIRPPDATRSPHEGIVNASNASTPPVVNYRRYPSLSDDGLPWFPRRSALESSSTEVKLPRFTSVRAIALLGIIALLTYLAITA